MRLRDRSTGEIMVLLVAGTVCGYVVVNGAVIIYLVLKGETGSQLTEAARNITDIINTLIGLLAGFLAGKTDVLVRRDKEKDQE